MQMVLFDFIAGGTVSGGKVGRGGGGGVGSGANRGSTSGGGDQFLAFIWWEARVADVIGAVVSRRGAVLFEAVTFSVASPVARELALAALTP